MEEEGCAHMGFNSRQAGLGWASSRSALGLPPLGESPNFPLVMGFPTGHFLAVTSGTQNSPCAPPFLVGMAPWAKQEALTKAGTDRPLSISALSALNSQPVHGLEQGPEMSPK